jgi:hypothetical protein
VVQQHHQVVDLYQVLVMLQFNNNNNNKTLKLVLIKLVDNSNNNNSNKHSKYLFIIQNHLNNIRFRFANQIPAHQVYNELLGPDAFKDVILDIDYGAMGGFNAAFQSGGDFSGGQLPPGISIRPAYTTVDSLNYQQHMFNTARTINAGGESSGYDYGGASSNYNYGGSSSAYDVSGGQQFNVNSGQQFDVAKALFNQADTNRDGGISREEFQNWAAGGQQNYGGQSYSASANYQPTTANYSGASDSFYQAGLLAGVDPSVANILQQSGLGQIVPNQ